MVIAYTPVVPKLWTETIETHRREVRDAILDTTVALVAEYGLLAVTMSQIAEETGIGRATLYKYFPDVEAILRAWHHRQIAGHLAYLAEVRDRAGGPGERLEAVLEAYALLSRGSHHDTDFAAFLHRDEQVARAQRQVHDMIRDLLTEAPRSVALYRSPWPACARPADSSRFRRSRRPEFISLFNRIDSSTLEDSVALALSSRRERWVERASNPTTITSAARPVQFPRPKRLVNGLPSRTKKSRKLKIPLPLCAWNPRITWRTLAMAVHAPTSRRR